MTSNNNLTNLVKLNSLETQTNTLLNQYKQSISNLKNTSQTKTKDDFSIFPNSSFWGSSAIKQTSGETIDTCINDCISDMTCSGATYDTNGTCYLRTGNGTIQSSLPLNQTAIVLNTVSNIQNTNDLNSKLLTLETQKSAILGNIESQISDMSSKNSQYSNSINSQIKQLNYNKNNIKHLYKKSNTLDNDYQNSYLIAMSNKWIYSILFYTIIIIFLGIIFKVFLK